MRPLTPLSHTANPTYTHARTLPCRRPASQRRLAAGPRTTSSLLLLPPLCPPPPRLLPLCFAALPLRRCLLCPCLPAPATLSPPASDQIGLHATRRGPLWRAGPPSSPPHTPRAPDPPPIPPAKCAWAAAQARRRRGPPLRLPPSAHRVCQRTCGPRRRGTRQPSTLPAGARNPPAARARASAATHTCPLGRRRARRAPPAGPQRPAGGGWGRGLGATNNARNPHRTAISAAPLYPAAQSARGGASCPDAMACLMRRARGRTGKERRQTLDRPPWNRSFRWGLGDLNRTPGSNAIIPALESTRRAWGRGRPRRRAQQAARAAGGLPRPPPPFPQAPRLCPRAFLARPLRPPASVCLSRPRGRRGPAPASARARRSPRRASHRPQPARRGPPRNATAPRARAHT
ncbi:MAG: hypothetical protein J3K34DRAFT_190903 [Monoraphidium minutum]|nr:MAG: hypothetical protein J3K34DRAFT_190903 [Monoraphidium minutum]